MTTFDAIIIGAGISGLTLASRLREQGKNFIILEKSKGVGGRIATRRDHDCTYDHGAQFVRVSPSKHPLGPEFLDIDKKGKNWFSSEGYDHLIFPGGMTQFPKSLAKNAEIKLNEKLSLIEELPDALILTTEQGMTYRTQKLYLTCPLPQSLALLTDSSISYPPYLNDLKYAPALVGLFRVFSFNPDLMDFKYRQDISHEIFSISNQKSKEVSDNLAFTAVMQPSWSENYFLQSESQTLQMLATLFKEALSQFCPKDEFVIMRSQLKKWRFSHPLQQLGTPFLALNANSRLVLLGDAFGGGSITGAMRSALAVPL